MTKRSENAIIIIGNGFDLAHDMKTSYNDFAEWYKKKHIIPKIISSIKTMNRDSNFFCSDYLEFIKLANTTYNNASEIILLRAEITKKFHHIDDINDIVNEMAENTSINKLNMQSVLKNNFLGKLYANSYDNWFDIENSYFSELKFRLDDQDINKSKNNSHSSVIELNLQFNEIKEALKTYLITVKIKNSQKVKDFFEENFIGKENINIVNFNYTKTINQYFDCFKYSTNTYDNNTIYTNVNYIHGDLDKKIIFGYGDDDSEDYKKMKLTGKDEYLENFKTFDYLDSNNYRNLINTIDNLKDYEVYVLGHSLSLTDKTLLYEILSPEKCLNIHLFKRADLGEDSGKIKEVKKLHFNISRILNHDSDSRKKIVPIENTPNFPYIENEDSKIIDKKYETIYNEERKMIMKDEPINLDPDVL